MTKIVRFLCALGLLATMLASSVLWSQDSTEISEPQTEEAVEQTASQKQASQQQASQQQAVKQTAPEQEAPNQKTGPDESSNNQESAAASKKKTTGDFKPSEEISEDFPVPLPSDI